MSKNEERELLNYGKQTLDEDDISAVVDVLRENKFLTTGPKVKEFEDRMKEKTDMKHAFAVCNGTAALHCAMKAIGIREGDEVIVPAISFIATANSVLYQGGTPIFCDIDDKTMNIDIDRIESLITNKTKAILVVDFCGQLCNYEKLIKLCKDNNLFLVEDAAHAVGVVKNTGADIITFSFHPVKTMTTGEGGMVLTNNDNFAKTIRQFRHHGIDVDYKTRYLHYYDIVDLGYNFRITDIQCALGISQLRKVDSFVNRRNKIAKLYDNAFNDIDEITPLEKHADSSYHLYIIKLSETIDRDNFIKQLMKYNIKTSVHYRPMYMNSYYEKLFSLPEGTCPVAEKIYKNIVTLPIYPTLTDDNVNYIVKCIKNVLKIV